LGLAKRVSSRPISSAVEFIVPTNRSTLPPPSSCRIASLNWAKATAASFDDCSRAA